MSHTVISFDPFTVEYKSSTGRTKQVKFEVPLTRAEILAEEPYIVFDEEPVVEVVITHFKKDGINTVYYEGKPVFTTTKAKLPLMFGFGSYNEPMKILNCGINVEDVAVIALFHNAD